MLTLRLPQDFRVGDSTFFEDANGEPTTLQWIEEDVLVLNDKARTIVDVEPIDGVLVFSVDEPEDDEEEDDEADL
jgi:hypothetical protein